MTTTQTERTRAFVADWMAGVPIIEAQVRAAMPAEDVAEHARAIEEARRVAAERREKHRQRVKAMTP